MPVDADLGRDLGDEEIATQPRRADVRPEGLQRLLDLIEWSGKQGVAGSHGV